MLIRMKLHFYPPFQYRQSHLKYCPTLFESKDILDLMRIRLFKLISYGINYS